MKVKTRLAELGGTALAGSPVDFGRLIADETEKWVHAPFVMAFGLVNAFAICFLMGWWPRKGTGQYKG